MRISHLFSDSKHVYTKLSTKSINNASIIYDNKSHYTISIKIDTERACSNHKCQSLKSLRCILANIKYIFTKKNISWLESKNMRSFLSIWLMNLERWKERYYCDNIHTAICNEEIFQEILRLMLENFLKILKKCFLSTTCIVTSLAGSNILLHVGVLSVSK